MPVGCLASGVGVGYRALDARDQRVDYPVAFGGALKRTAAYGPSITAGRPAAPGWGAHEITIRRRIVIVRRRRSV